MNTYRSFFGKRIGIALSLSNLQNPAIAGVIKRLLLAGAEVCLVLLDPRQEHVHKKPAPVQNLERAMHRHKTTEGKMVDLWVIVPDSENLLVYLVQHVKKEKTVPLVLLPVFRDNPNGTLRHLSLLMEHEQVYFVPFGVLLNGTREEQSTDVPSFFCRTDLLVETCGAALQGQRIEPAVWENCIFPN